MLKGTLRERSPSAADAVDRALRAKALHVSVGSFLDLRYLVDSGRVSAQLLEEARSIVDSGPFTVVPLYLPVLDAMATVPKETVPDPVDSIIAATALTLDLRLLRSDARLQEAVAP